MKKVLGGISFAAIVLLLLSAVGRFLEPEGRLWCQNMYALEEDSADVMFFGSSNVYSNINPAILYEKAGITSYIMGGSGQPIWNSYYYLREAYQTQHPKLVVIDMKSLIYDVDYMDLPEAYLQVEGLKWSFNKLEAIKASSEQEALSLLFGYPIYHTRWRENKALFMEDNDKYGAMEMGFYPVYNVHHAFPPDYHPGVSADVTKMREKNETYLRKMIELAQEKGSEVLLLKTPYVINEYADSIYNHAEQIAAEYQVACLNMNKVDFGFVYGLELADTEHLNNYGVKRVTDYLCEYMQANFELPNRGGGGGWDRYLETYRSTQFQCPPILETEAVIAETGTVPVEHVAGVPTVLEYPIALAEGNWYRVSIDMTSDCCGGYAVDFYSINNYDNGQQDSFVPVYPGESTAVSYIYTGDELIPEDTVFRVIVVVPYDISFDIHSILVEKLTVEG